MSNLKIAIIGIGSVGGYLGAKLIQYDHDVTLIARGKNYETIKQNGLKIIDYKSDNFIVYPYIVQSVEDDIFDIVFITTQNYNFESACHNIKTCIDKNTLIIPLSNGVEHSQTIKQYLPNNTICDGAIYLISQQKEYGIIQRKSFTFYLIFGSQKENINLKVLEQLLNNSKLRSKYSSDIKYDTWKKFLFISSTSSLTSYFKNSIGYILEEQIELLIDILLEIKKVANEKGIKINSNDIEKAIKQATHLPYQAKTSMQLDFEKNKTTEIESLIGYIVHEAKNLNLHTPQLEKIYNSLITK